MARRSQGFNTPFAKLKVPNKAPPAPRPPPPPRDPEPPALDDDELFLQAMHGVSPVQGDGRIEPPKRRRAERPSDDEEVMQELERLVSGEGSFDFDVDTTGEMVWGKAPGVQRRIIDKLRKGQIAVRRHIDLHGYTREEAKERLVAFITESRRDDQGCVLVVTGRGLGSPQGVSVLRDALPRWLSRSPLTAHVLAFCTARRVDGGPGAFYVLLRRPGVRPFG